MPQLYEAKLLTKNNFEAVIGHNNLCQLYGGIKQLKKDKLLTQQSFDELVKTYKPDEFSENLISTEKENRYRFQDKPNSAIFSKDSVVLVYGFYTDRKYNNSSAIREKKFIIEQLNMALGINFLNAHLIEKLQNGIEIENFNIDLFSKETGIEKTISRELLTSWSTFLKEHYDFISIQSYLKRKYQKYDDVFAEYVLRRNHPTLQNTQTLPKLDEAKSLFSIFSEHGDQQGCAKTEATYIPIEAYTEDKGIVGTALDNAFFRRTSKLALIWSHQVGISVIFYISFFSRQAEDKVKNTYRPITYSEYHFFKQQKLNHVTEIDTEAFSSRKKSLQETTSQEVYIDYFNI